jgi:hypothetical protein
MSTELASLFEDARRGPLAMLADCVGDIVCEPLGADDELAVTVVEVDALAHGDGVDDAHVDAESVGVRLTVVVPETVVLAEMHAEADTVALARPDTVPLMLSDSVPLVEPHAVAVALLLVVALGVVLDVSDALLEPVPVPEPLVVELPDAVTVLVGLAPPLGDVDCDALPDKLRAPETDGE